MLRLVTTCMLVYYALGVFLLGGVFVRLMHLPEMYAHCKATEEADMDLWDFLEDHVTCFGAVFEVPEADDEDLPHASDEDYVAPTPVTAPDAWPR
ncbi:MAG: hypothetical protein KDC02_19030, partial [Flavobacteriales bacterium]|nr:hypothetical protein [Flavobacteriales bacterium]